MKFKLVEEIQDNKVTLEVKFEVYGRYGDGGEIITAKVSGKDLRHALMRMCDKMRLYIDSDDIKERNLTAEQILDSISETNGDGCDMIYMLRNLTTNEVLIDCSDCYEEQDWDDDFEDIDESKEVNKTQLQESATKVDVGTIISELDDFFSKKGFNTSVDYGRSSMFVYKNKFGDSVDLRYGLIVVGIDEDELDDDTFGLADGYPAIYVYEKADKDRNNLPDTIYQVVNASSDAFDTNSKKEAINKVLSWLPDTDRNELKESFSNNFESRDLQDTGELISALKELVKEYGHMELEKEVYLETVENDHGRQLKIGFNVAESLTEAVKTPVVPEPYNKYLEIVPEEELDIEWHAKECSYDIAKEIAECAKRSLKLPAHEVEMLEHDINNLRSNEWVEQFSKLPMKSKARELFFKYAVERDEYGTGDKVSGATILGTLGPKDGYEDLFDSWYFLVDDPDFPVVEIVHDRLYPVELPELKEDVFQDLAKKINEMDKNAREYIYDRLNDYYMPYEPEADKKKVTEIIFNKLKTCYREMFDFIPYWGREEEGADELWDEGVDENIIDLIAYENFPESIIGNIVSDQGYMNPDNY